MPTISSPGVGSGLDVNTIVDKLMAVERRPIDLLDKKKSTYDTELSAYGKLSSALADFQSAMSDLDQLSNFSRFTTTSSDESVFTATTSENAAIGASTINVTALAQHHKLYSAAFADTATTVGTGTLTIAVGGNSFDVVIDGSNNTLTGIRDAINEANGNTGVTATIINADDGSHLVFTANESGTSNSLNITVNGDGDGSDTDNAGLSQLVYTAGGTTNLSVLQAAADAQLTIDGFAITSASNTVDGVLQGVSLQLNAVGSGSLTVSRDNSAVKDSVQNFVDTYNQLGTTLKDLRSGDLQGDSTLLTIRNQFHSVFNSAATGVSGSYSYLSEIGVSFQKDGSLGVDTASLDKALTTDFSGVAKLFADSNIGFATRLKDTADALLGSDGVIETRKDGINASITRLQDRRAVLEQRMTMVETRYRAEFTRLDGLLGQLQGTSNFLLNQLSNIPVPGKN